YACSGRSTLTPLGTYRNEPPDQTAPCSAENLLSCGGTHLFMKYFCTSSGYWLIAVSIEQNRIPSFAYSSLRPSEAGTWSQTPTTPARCSRSAWGMPRSSYVCFISSGTSSQLLKRPAVGGE